MPWKASSVMEEKVGFVVEYERYEQTMRELCESFGISRETGYVWLRRFRALGLAVLLSSPAFTRKVLLQRTRLVRSPQSWMRSSPFIL